MALQLELDPTYDIRKILLRLGINDPNEILQNPRISWVDGRTWFLELTKYSQSQLNQALADYLNNDHTNTLLQPIRSKRDEELRKSDWTQLSDAPLDSATKTAWANWRQQLRDLPQLYTDPVAAETALTQLIDNKP